MTHVSGTYCSWTNSLLYTLVRTPETQANIRSFSLEEVLVIKKMKNNQTSGGDTIINYFFKHCHNDCSQLIVVF